MGVNGVASVTLSKSRDSVQAMFDGIAHRYELTNVILSGGVHLYWKWRLLRAVPAGLRVALDLCTGPGALLSGLKKRCQQVIGVDFSREMLRAGAAEDRSSVAQGDALSLPFCDNTFDLITVAYGVRNFEDLDSGLREIARVLAPGGRLLVLEFGQPSHPLLRALNNIYSRVVLPFIGGMLTGDRAAYTYLPQTAATFPCGEDFLKRARQSSGLSPMSAQQLTGGIAYLYTLTK
jgi:demethylmenaquinone methyltransferase/2-methoxy-6-polyprenyl-1,4-benzoquinol methylase